LPIIGGVEFEGNEQIKQRCLFEDRRPKKI